MNTQELLKKLPASWDEVTLAKFQLLTTTEITETEDILNGMENSIAVISKLTGVSIDELESMSMNDLAILSNKLTFMLTPPQSNQKTSVLVWKKLHEITYNDYVNFIQLQDKQLENMHVFIKSFSKTELTEEEVLQLSIPECLTGFFLLKKMLQKYLKASIKSTLWQVTKFKVKQKLAILKKKIT